MNKNPAIKNIAERQDILMSISRTFVCELCEFEITALFDKDGKDITLVEWCPRCDEEGILGRMHLKE